MKRIIKEAPSAEDYTVFRLFVKRPMDQIGVTKWCRKANCNAGFKTEVDMQNYPATILYVCIEKGSPLCATFKLKYDCNKVNAWSNGQFTIYVRD